MKKNEKIEQLSKELGFTRALFLDEDFVFIREENKKELLKKIKKAKKKNLLTIYQPSSEELLRFALEKTPVNMVVGMEKINPKDSVHFVRSGLDPVLCKITHDQKKIIAFSFNDILKAKDKGKLMGRTMFNIKLCRKYKVKIYFGSFAASKFEIRSARDLETFLRLLGGVSEKII